MSSRIVVPGPIHGRIAAPPSKSYTHRALVAGFLSGRRYQLRNPLESDDTLRTAAGLEALGAEVLRTAVSWTVRPGTDRPGRGVPKVDCGDSGTTLRFLVALAARSNRPTVFRRSRSLASRPIEPLLRVLRAGGVEVTPPPRSRLSLRVRGPLRPVRSRLDASKSSQFLSGLLFVLPTLDGPSYLRLERAPVSRPYLAATIAVLAAHGVTVAVRPPRVRIPGSQKFVGSGFDVPGDASSAAYLWAAAALTGGRVTVTGIEPRWPQADLKVLAILRSMGAEVRTQRTGVTVTGPVRSPVHVDLTSAPDLLPLVGVLAAAVPDRSTLVGAGQARLKESDRRRETTRLVRSLGGRVRTPADRIEIEGAGRWAGFRYDGATDHRMVMSAAVAALGARGRSEIRSATSVEKSYPGFWEALGQLGIVTEVRR